MNIHIAGVNHNDPLGRQNLRRWLNSCSEIYVRPPEFVAVEWSEVIYRHVQQQRERFRELLRNEWPLLPEDVLTTLETSLAYEADTHIEMFPGSQTIWLDKGREIGRNLANFDYHVTMLERYKSFLREKHHIYTNAQIISDLSKVAWEASREDPSITPSRDSKWAECILLLNSQYKEGWAAIIVGANHASDVENSLASILRNANALKDSISLDPDNPIPN